MTAFAFKCMDCGHLAEGPEAGENKVPYNCRHCDIGSHIGWFLPGIRNEVPEGTEGAYKEQVIDRHNEFLILADLTEKQQAEILAKQASPGDTIERYVPTV